MISDFKPYPRLKDSGVPRLGEVPEHWELRKLRQVLRYRTERNRPDLPLLSVVREQGVVVRDTSNADQNHNYIPDDLSNYKVVRVGQFAMNKMKAWQGSYGVSGYDGIVSPAYFVFDLDTVTGPFFNTAIRSQAYVPFFAQASDGVRVGQWDLSEARMREIPFLVPPHHEQAAIVRYIHVVDQHIRRYIRAKQKLIKLLEEQRQAIIHHAVTRGLDPNVRLKPSGVEWLGEVPEHWDLVPNRSLLRLERRLVGGSWNKYQLLSLTKRGVILRDMQNPEGKFPTSFETYQEIKPGDLVFCLFDIDETPRAVGLSDLHGMITGAYTRFSCEPSVADWVHLYYVAMDNGKRLKPLYTGLRKVIPKSSFLSAKMPLPPPTERAQIVGFVQGQLDVADEARDRAQNEISLLRQYRARLIADVVTGKLDVREVAARLLEEADGPDPHDETDIESYVLDTDTAEVDKVPEGAEA